MRIMTDDKVTQSKNILERFSLKGKVALVTGGGQGIGRGFAHALADAGADVAVVDLNITTAEGVVQEIKSRNPNVKAIALKVDVTVETQVKSMVEQVVEKLGGLTIACNNAGIGEWVDSEKMPYEDFQKVMKVNLDSVFLCSQAEANHMLGKGYGKIINTASMSGHIANYPQNQSAYNISKSAVLSLTRSLATEWADRGVRVNSISPGYTQTALVEDLLKTELGQKVWPVWKSLIPQGKMAEVTDLQGAVVFLASSVSDYMTGADLLVDGGYVAW
jgi:NAD(P)-dependent dehydrogenase (short-subunit alcohol dehydrogenase family)